MNHSLIIKNRIDEIGRLTSFVSQLSAELNLVEQIEYKLNLVIEELVSNIIFYGYNEGIIDEISISIEVNKNDIIIEIIDSAKPFNPLKFENNQKKEILENKEVGGLGILFVKKICRELRYERVKNKNVMKVILENYI